MVIGVLVATGDDAIRGEKLFFGKILLYLCLIPEHIYGLIHLLNTPRTTGSGKKLRFALDKKKAVINFRTKTRT